MRSPSAFKTAAARWHKLLCIFIGIGIITSMRPSYAQPAALELPKAPQSADTKNTKKTQYASEDKNFKPTRTKPSVLPFFVYGVMGTLTLGSLAWGIYYTYEANIAARDTKNQYAVIEGYRVDYTDVQSMCKLKIVDSLCKEQDQHRANWDTYRKLAIGGYVVAGAVALGTGIGSMLAYRWPERLTKNKYRHRDTLSSFEMAPILAPTQQGLQLKITF